MDLVDHTELSNSIWEGRFYWLSDPREIIGAGNQDILNPSGFNIGQHVKQEAGAFSFTDPHARNLFQARVPEPDSRLQPVEVPNQLTIHLQKNFHTIFLIKFEDRCGI